ncbi:MAG: hypothetical protein MJZ74_08065 [Muribaculaceae bacterium]|nr:hypothetical protein [Muribaculaceae bacterium]
MKKVLFLLVFVLVSLALSAKVVRPVKYNWTVKHIPDGKYLVSVDWKTAKAAKDGCYLTFEIFLPDRYTVSMLDNLAVGDYFYFNSETVKVLNKKRERGFYIVNYEEDNEYSGIQFTGNHVKGYYTPCYEASGPEWFYTSHGKVTLKVLKFHAFCDFDHLVFGSRIAPYILKYRESELFNYLEWSSITVKNGKVVLLKSFCGE